jgi:hypothetical protein
MLTSSCKAKGRSLQKLVVQAILKAFPSLTENDVMSRPMGSQGTDVILSEAALKAFPYSVECKNVEKLNVWSSLQQTLANQKRSTTAILIVKRNHTAPYVMLPLDKFMELVTHEISRNR